MACELSVRYVCAGRESESESPLPLSPAALCEKTLAVFPAAYIPPAELMITGCICAYASAFSMVSCSSSTWAVMELGFAA